MEVHPTEIAFDIETAHRALKAVNHHPAFGFNFDPSHLGYQGVDYMKFIYDFADRIFHVHMKDVYWSNEPKTVAWTKEHGARESCAFVRRADFKPSAMAFDSNFAQ